LATLAEGARCPVETLSSGSDARPTDSRDVLPRFAPTITERRGCARHSPSSRAAAIAVAAHPSAPSRPVQSGYLSAAIGRRGHRHRPGTFPESAARPSSRRRHRQFAPADSGIAARARKMSSADTAADDSIFVVVVHFILL